LPPGRDRAALGTERRFAGYLLPNEIYRPDPLFAHCFSGMCALSEREQNESRRFAGCLLLHFDWMRQATGAAVFWRWQAPSVGKAMPPRMTVLFDRAERPDAPLRVIRGFGSCCIAGAVYP